MNAANISPEARMHFAEGVRLSQHPGTVEAAAAAFERAIQLCPGYEEAYFELGTMYYRWSHFQKAIDPLKKAIELAPDQPAAYGNLGMNYNLAGKYHDAEDVVRRLLDIVPDHIAGNYELGVALLLQGRSEEAVQYFRRTVQLHPQHVQAYFFLSQTLVCNLRDFVGARQLLSKVKDLHPHLAERLSHLISLNES